MKRLLRNLRTTIVRWWTLRRKFGLFHTAEIVCRRPDGSIAWREAGRLVPNRLFNAGEALALRTLYRGESVLGAAFYGRLYNDTPTDTDTLGSLTGEPVGNGYAPVNWDRNTTDWAAVELLGSGVSRTVGAQKSFTASGGDIGPVTAFVLSTTSDNSGSPYAWFNLSEARTIENGFSLDVRPIGNLRGVTS